MRVLIVFSLLFTSSLFAHFQMIIPQDDNVWDLKPKKIQLMFMHPFEQTYMYMQKPNEFGYFLDKKKHTLLKELKEVKYVNGNGWNMQFSFKQIGDYIFYVDPKPYFEPSEEKFIRHQTKVIVDAHGANEGWDEPIGFKAEIIPLVRPYGLYENNLFGGIVTYKGKPVPFAKIEVEYFNVDKKEAPTQNHITQVIKADSNGVFYYAIPEDGWWGFAALIEDDVLMQKDQKSYPVELGAVIWVKAKEGF